MPDPKIKHYCSTAALQMGSPVLENCFHTDTTSVTSIMAMVDHPDFPSTKAIDASQYECSTEGELSGRAKCTRKASGDDVVVASFARTDAASDTNLFFRFGDARVADRAECLDICSGRAMTVPGDDGKDRCYCLAKSDDSKVVDLLGKTCDPATQSCIHILRSPGA